MREFLALRLDSVNQCLWKRGDDGEYARVRLAPKAFDVLRYLTENAGRLVTHSELLDNLWPRSVVQPAVLKSQILEVRAALGDDAKNPRYIETVPRRGYRFIAPIRDERDALPGELPTDRALLVGRERPLADLHACMQRVTRGQRQIVFVTGEPGLGKTALVDEFSAQVLGGLGNATLARGQCVEGYGGKEPYYPMLESLRELCASPPGESIVRKLAARAPTWLVQLPGFIRREHRAMLQRELQGATRERMLREIGEFLTLVTASAPLVLVFEDLQWVDNSTLDLISALSRGRGPAKLMLICTYRTADVVAPENPLGTLKQELQVHHLCSEVELAPLKESDISDFLNVGSSTAGLPDGLAALIHKHSEGNPLFMVAAIEHLTRRGLIYKGATTWHLRVPLEEIGLEVPDGLRQMVEARISRLSAEEQGALEVASVVGVAFSADVCAGALESDAERTQEVYDGLVRRRQLLRPLSDQQDPAGLSPSRYEFVHAIYREVLYKRQIALRRARLHHRIGERLEHLFASRLEEVAPALAYHFEHGSNWSRAISYLKRAAITAVQRYAPREAEAILEDALRLVPRLPEADQCIELELLETIATIYVLGFDRRASATYETLIAKAQQYGAVDVEVRAQIALALPTAWNAPPRRYIEVLDRALQLSARQEPAKAALTRTKCLLWRVAAVWDFAHAEECREAYSEFRKSPDRKSANRLALASQLMDYSAFHCNSSQYREALRCATESFELLAQDVEETGGLNAIYSYGQFFMQRILGLLGEWGMALKVIDATIDTMIRNASPAPQLQRLNASWVHLYAMDFSGAWEHCQVALPLLSDPLWTIPRRDCLILSGTALTGLGNFDRALEFFAQARAALSEHPTMSDWYSKMPLEAGETEFRIASGDRGRARRQAECFLEVTLATSERTWQALAWEANARVSMAENDKARAVECVTRGLEAIEGFETPVASWRIHATAAFVCEHLGDTIGARQHRGVAATVVQKLADSLPPEAALRRAFLNSPRVLAVLGPA